MTNYARFQQVISIARPFTLLRSTSVCQVVLQIKILFSLVSTLGLLRFILVQVVWNFPEIGWIKVNTDGTSTGSPGFTACAGILKDSRGEYIGSFSAYLGIQNSLYAEIMGAILAIELAQSVSHRRLAGKWLFLALSSFFLGYGGSLVY